MTAHPFCFIQTATPAERRALFASTLGWMLDGMDVTLYAMVIAELMRELGLSSAQAGLLASTTLVATAFPETHDPPLAPRDGTALAPSTDLRC